MDAERDERLRRRQRWLRFTTIAGIGVALGSHASRRWGMEIGGPTLVAFLIAIEVMAGVFVIASLIANRRMQRRIRAGRQGERWPLGEPYRVTFQHRGRGDRTHGELHVGPEDLTLLVEFGERTTVALADVTVVRVRATGIDVETARATLILTPASYADRQRLLWELAVRCPDAMERGLDESAPPPARPAPPAWAPPTPDEHPSGPSGLALGSTLAGPMDRANPAPPRKSGLGVGLFVPPPGQRGDREM
jgi:hypothetical protein